VDAALPREPSRSSVTPADYKGKVDFAILTVVDDEFEAVLDRFPPFGQTTGRRVYNLHRLDLPGGDAYVVAILRCIEMGNGEALSAARDVLEDLEPRWLLSVGIAAGLPSNVVTLGDVVVSTQIVDFDIDTILTGKTSEYTLTGGPVHKDAAVVLANLGALAGELGAWGSAASVGTPRPRVDVDVDVELSYGDEAWRWRAREGLARQAARTEPVVTAGAIASSDQLIDDTEPLASALLGVARQVLAVEMESSGGHRAATERGVPHVAIRGLSDMVGLKRDPGWRAYACNTAAAFTRAFLQTQPIAPRRVPLPEGRT
jgi:nucleoside phosphorylase